MVFDSGQTATLRASVRARRDLVAHRVAVGNQLLAHLQAVFPGAATLFSAMHKGATLSFLEQYTTANRPTGSRSSGWAPG